MSLVTLDLDEVAEVIDEAVTRHSVISHNKIRQITIEIESFHASLKEINKRLDEIGEGQSEIESVKFLENKIVKLHDDLLTLNEHINNGSNGFDEKLVGFATQSEITLFNEKNRSEVDDIRLDVKSIDSKITLLNERLVSLKSGLKEQLKNINSLNVKVEN